MHVCMYICMYVYMYIAIEGFGSSNNMMLIRHTRECSRLSIKDSQLLHSWLKHIEF